MTIEEYLHEPRKLKAKSERLYKKMIIAEEKATSPKDPLNLGDGVPGRRSNGNATEDRILNYIDAGRAYDKAYRQYVEVREALSLALDNLLYWQGCLIYQIYIYNVAVNASDDLTGAGDILRTNNKREILAKLSEARKALADQLRAQGVEIDDEANEVMQKMDKNL